MLEVPVVLGHLVERAAATQDGRQVGQDVDAAELGDRALDERRVRGEVAQVGDDPDVAGSLERADELVEARPGRDPRP